MAKKKTTQIIDDATQQYKQQQEQSDAALAASQQAAAEQRQQTYNSAQESFRQAFDSGAKDIADIALSKRAEAQKAEQEAQQQVEADKKAARWTGATELAASLINLVGVGSGNAAPQQYHQFSADWMKKADDDLTKHRARIQNLSDRANEAKASLANLRMGEAKEALATARKQAEQIYANQIAQAQAAAESREKAAAIQYKGDMAKADMQLKEEKEANDMAIQQQNLNQRRINTEADLVAHGLKMENGHPVVDENSEIYKANLEYTKRRGAGTGASKSQVFYRDGNNNLVSVPMTALEYQTFLDKVYEMAKDDPTFAEAYDSAKNEQARRSLLFAYASNEPSLRAELDARRGVQENQQPDQQGPGFLGKVKNKIGETIKDMAEQEDERYNEFE